MASSSLTPSRRALLVAWLLLGMAGAARAEVRPLGALPYNSNPTDTLFEGQDGFLYGVLAETNLPNPKVTNGAVFQMSPTGSIRFLHLFPRQWMYPSPNVGGSQPSRVLSMGKDGYLYGLTTWGGAYGYGVFYRLGTDGSYQVITDVPANTQLAYGIGSWLLGPDGALYAYSFSSIYTNGEGVPLDVLRFGLDGSIQTIFRPTPKASSGCRLEPLNEDHSRIRVSWIEDYERSNYSHNIPYGRKGIAHSVILELPSGEVIAREEIPFLTGLPEAAENTGNLGEWRYARFVGTQAEERIFCSDYWAAFIQSGQPCRLLSVNAAGQVSVLANYGASMAQPDLPNPVKFLPSATGQLYFTSGEQKKGPIGLFGGTQINLLTPDQPVKFQKLVDLDGYPLAAWTESRDHHIYGVAWGPVSVGLGEDLNSDDDAETGVTALHGPRTPRSSDQKSKPRRAFRRTNPADPSLAPVARSDRYALAARRTAPALKAAVLRNDFDPAKGTLSLTSVGTPQHGTVAIQPGVNPYLIYTPSDWPRQSDVFTYTITNPHGKTAVGQVRIRANLTSSFRGVALAQTLPEATAPVTVDSLALKVRPTGKFAGSVKINGKAVPLAGVFDYSDRAYVTRRIRATGEVVEIHLSLGSTDERRHLAYEVRYLHQTLSGTLAAR